MCGSSLNASRCSTASSVTQTASSTGWCISSPRLPPWPTWGRVDGGRAGVVDRAIRHSHPAVAARHRHPGARHAPRRRQRRGAAAGLRRTSLPVRGGSGHPAFRQEPARDTTAGGPRPTARRHLLYGFASPSNVIRSATADTWRCAPAATIKGVPRGQPAPRTRFSGLSSSSGDAILAWATTR